MIGVAPEQLHHLGHRGSVKKVIGSARSAEQESTGKMVEKDMVVVLAPKIGLVDVILIIITANGDHCESDNSHRCG